MTIIAFVSMFRKLLCIMNLYEYFGRVINKEIGSLALMRELGLTKDTYFRYIREYKKNIITDCSALDEKIKGAENDD